MKIILSPAKRLNEQKFDKAFNYTQPVFLTQSSQLINILKKKSVFDIKNLMSLSDHLAELNFKRFKNWDASKIEHEGKASIFMFEGDAYKGLDVSSFSNNEIEYLNGKLFILSGLYGVLKPLDKILPYRLEMGTVLENKKGKQLYDFWKSELTQYFNLQLQGETLINLASKEYSAVIDFKKLNSKVIQVEFLQEKEGNFKNIALFSKRARGLMTAFISKNKLENSNDLRAFDAESYFYNNHLSKENHLVFTRIRE